MLFNPDTFVPSSGRIAAATAHVDEACETAWALTHCGKCLTEAIEELSTRLDIPYDLASSLVWSQMSSPAVRFPD